MYKYTLMVQIKYTTNKVYILQRGTFLGGGKKFEKNWRKSTNKGDSTTIFLGGLWTNKVYGFIIIEVQFLSKVPPTLTNVPKCILKFAKNVSKRCLTLLYLDKKQEFRSYVTTSTF